MQKISFKPNINWLLSPWLILIGVITGGSIGVFDKELAGSLLPFGLLYLKLLQMLVLPMLLTAVISGLGNLFASGIKKNQLSQLIIFLLTGLMIASFIGLLFGIFGQPGTELQHDAQVTLGRTINQTEHSSLVTDNEQAQAPSMFSYIQAMIPENIFTSLTRGDTLAILFFSLLTGVSMGMLNSDANKSALLVVHAFYSIFLTIIGWMMYLLPFGLLCLFAGQLAQVGLDIVWATAKLIQYIYMACIATMFIYSLIIWWKVRDRFSYFQSLAGLRQPLAVALGTSSSFATIPTALNALKNNLKVDENVSDFVLPLGVTINPPRSVLQFAISSMFIAQIYGMELTLDQFSMIFMGAILAGLASSSAPSVVALSMITMILDPLGLPSSVAIILLIAIDPVVDPIVTALNVHANCALSVVISDESENSKQTQEHINSDRQGEDACSVIEDSKPAQ
ncbi:MAG: dicarboxylate/amino acid:cation symporter [Methylococcaceae bacterium]|nr:dicarboxylate/amino acid:cation symporter [Methylococcaceae bacterium]